MHAYVKVAGVGDIPDPGSMVVDVEGEPVALFHVDGAYHALDDICTHDGGPLANGELVGFKVACPRHGARFDVRSGAALSMPAVRATRAHDVKVEDGALWVRLRDVAGSPGPPAPASFPVAAPAVMPTSMPSMPRPDGPSPAPESTDTAPQGELSEDLVRELLKAVKDPELFVNIVDLGLVYGVGISAAADVPGQHHVAIDMTMTSPACPAGPQLIADTKRTLAAHPHVAAVEVRIVMDPPWTPDRMTDDARDQLGIF